ncbi:hypothetical protein [Actinoplanes sp. NPDC049681]|uniref:hypothetical protein n=1 Tax=Actinoplanes sp. NPDC049681 TaxID=3363905 RepID=UPI0037B50608
MARFPAALVALGLVASVAACARSGDPTGTPTAGAKLEASIEVPTPYHSRIAVAPGTEVAHCGDQPISRSAAPRPATSLSEAQKRAEEALRAADRPTPQRAPVPARALPAAEACVRLLRPQLNLLAANGDLDQQRLRDHLAQEGLKAVVRPDLSFTGMVGAACVYGTLPSTGPTFELGPRNTDGSC